MEITVSSSIICDDIPLLFTSYKKQEVTENEKATILVYDDNKEEILKNYELEIAEIYPFKGPFKIEDGNIVMEKVDREDDRFEGVNLPQLRVTIMLNKKSSESKLKKTIPTYFAKSIEDDQCVIMPNKINNLQQTIVTVILKDVNDNDPVFKDGNNIIVGYPEEVLASRISPPYVTIVEVSLQQAFLFSKYIFKKYLFHFKATDKDAGENAQIKYSLDTTDFVIHPTSGIIYPTTDSFGDKKKFKVIASDKNGASDGRKATLQVEVCILF